MQNSDSKNIPCDFPEKGRKILHEMNSLQKKKKKRSHQGAEFPEPHLRKQFVTLRIDQKVAT